MEESYRVGVTIALGGNIGKVIEQLIKQFETLDRAIQHTQGCVNQLVSGMRALNREGSAAANTWRGAAASMERAARAARDAATASARYGRTGGRRRSGSSVESGDESVGEYGVPAVSVASVLATRRNQSVSATPAGGYRLQQYPGLPAPGGTNLLPYMGITGYSRIPGSVPRIGSDGNRIGFDGTIIDGEFQEFFPGALARRYGVGGGGGGGAGGGGRFLPPPNNGGVPGPAIPRGPHGQPINPIDVNLTDGYPRRDRLMDRMRSGKGPDGLGQLNMLNAGVPAWLGGDLIENIYAAGAKVEDDLRRLQGIGFDKDQLTEAKTQAFRLQSSVVPTTVPGNLELLYKIQSVTQNVEESMKLLPAFTQLGVALQRAGKGGPQELVDAIKSAENRGELSKIDPATGNPVVDVSGLESYIRHMLATTVVSGGVSDPTSMLQFQRRGGFATGNLSDNEFFARTIALQQALGPGGAGTALAGFINQFASGKMSKASANLMIQMGLIQGGGTTKTNPNVLSNGPFNVMLLPGAFPPGMQMLASTDTSKFIEQVVMPKIREYLAKKLGRPYTEADAKSKSIMEMNLSGTIASSRSGSKELSEVVRMLALIDRDTAAVQAALQRPLQDILTKDNPVIAAQGLPAALNAFEVALAGPSMGPAVSALQSLTSGLNVVSDWAGKHAEVTKIGMEALAGAVLAIGAAGVVAALAALGPTSALIIGIGAGVGAIVAALKELDSALHSLFPWAYATKSPPIDPQHPVQRPAWMDPLDSASGFVKFLRDHMMAPAADPVTGRPLPGSFAPQAPAPSNTSQPVHLTEPVIVGNGKDLVHGVSKGQADQTNRPPSGPSGYNTNIDVFGSVYGGGL